MKNAAFLLDKGGATIRTAICHEIAYGNEMKQFEEPASQMRPLVSKAAHRTPPIKDTSGTEINPLPCQKVFFCS